jgi:hypothetical protein
MLPKNSKPQKRTTRERNNKRKQNKNDLQLLLFANWASQLDLITTVGSMINGLNTASPTPATPAAALGPPGKIPVGEQRHDAQRSYSNNRSHLDVVRMTADLWEGDIPIIVVRTPPGHGAHRICGDDVKLRVLRTQNHPDTAPPRSRR